jgi:O-antigen ligase
VIGLGALCWPVVAYLASEADFHIWFTENVHPNWGYRIAIWGRVSELISENVLIGYGFDASRFIGETAGLIPDAAGRTSFMHPHNGFLQIWLELGLVGVALFSATAILSVRQTVRRAPNRQALAVAAGTITASSVTWLLSFGIWQAWWLAALGLNVCAATLLFRLMVDVERTHG